MNPLFSIVNDLTKALKKFFGFSDFRAGQKEVIESLLYGNDTLVIMPTGVGKSLCYQLPALILDGTAIVFSPLISLMKDQTDALHALNLKSTFINSSLSNEEISIRTNEIIRGEHKIIYIAPERLESKGFISLLSKINISFIAIDEAHCVSEWGHDFRPSYLNIPKYFPNYDKLTKIALTATATPEVQNDIIDLLKMRKVKRFVRGFDRPNLKYVTILCKNKEKLLDSLIRDNPGQSRIIYCGSRKRVEKYHHYLNNVGIKSLLYHAGLDPSLRQRIQDKFFNNETPIIIATNAFGMGIDHPNVRQVIHLDYTASLEAYYQEAGRAGRDGLPAECMMIYYHTDKKLQEYFINSTFPEIDTIKLVYNKLYDIPQIALGYKARKEQNINEVLIANLINIPVRAVSSVLSFLERNGIIKYELAQNNIFIKFNDDLNHLKDYFYKTDDFTRNILESILRNISSEAFNRPVLFNIYNLYEKFNLDYTSIYKIIRKLELAGILSYYDENQSSIKYQLERKRFEDLQIDWDKYIYRKDLAFKKLEVVINYARTKECKRAFILNYFNEIHDFNSCGNCSSCSRKEYVIPQDTHQDDELADKILKAAKFLNGKFGRTVFTNFLKGIKNKIIEKYNLHTTKYFGICRNYTIEQLQDKIEDLLENSKLFFSVGKYPKIYTKVDLQEDKEILDVKYFQNNIDEDLLIELKKLRDSISIRENLPLNLIADDKSLERLAQYLPKHRGELGELRKYEVYLNQNFSNLFIDCISKYLDIPENQQIYHESEPLLDIVIDLMQSSNNISQVAQKLSLSKGEVAFYLEKAIDRGYQFNNFTKENQSLINKVKFLISKNINLPLRAIRANLELDIDFADLRLIVAIARNELNHSR